MDGVKYIDFYNRALKNYIDMSANDPTSILAKEHGLIGLTRILMTLHHIGIKDGDCTITALPDHTFTRSSTRWSAGFAYGAIISIKSPDTPFIPLDVLPNCCGVIVAEINELPCNIYDIKSKLDSIIESYSEIDASDFKRGNHFIGVYKDLDKFYVLLHCSFKRSKKSLNSHSHYKFDVKSLNVLGKDFKFVSGDNAVKYYSTFCDENELSMKYRGLVIQDLFPSAKILFNQMHQGFYDINNILLGAYASPTPFSCPIMLTPENDISIINVDKPISVFGADFYCAPHGGGYAIQGVSMIRRSIEFPNVTSDYILEYNNGSLMLTDSITDLPYKYRDNTDIQWCNNYRMGEIINKLKPIYNLKI